MYYPKGKNKGREVRTLRESECYIESRSVLVTVYLKYIILYCGVIMCVRLVLQSVLSVCNREPVISCSRVDGIPILRYLRSWNSYLCLPMSCGLDEFGYPHRELSRETLG